MAELDTAPESEERQVAAWLHAERRVEPRAIERELAQLWNKIVADSATGMISRASVLNLMVLVEADATDVTDMVRAVAAHHPGRVIVLRTEPGGEDGFEASVGALRLRIERHAPTSFAEYVHVVARGDAVNRVPEFALPLLMPMVPTALCWVGPNPLDNPLFARLAVLADRILVDSAGFANPTQGLKRLAQMVGERSRWQGLGDVAWGRITPWRRLAAQFFDMPCERATLPNLDRIEVTYGADGATGDNPVEALLFVGWLASRLRWEFSDTQVADGAVSARYRLGGREITVHIKPDKECRDLAGQLVSARLEATGEPAVFTVQRSTDRLSVKTESKCRDTELVARVAPVEAADLATAVDEELRLLRQDRTYRRALAAAARMVR